MSIVQLNSLFKTFLASSWIWVASSLVGARINAIGYCFSGLWRDCVCTWQTYQ